MIEGVIVKGLKTYPDERGFFREIVRFPEVGFVPRQASQGLRVSNMSNGWHIHRFLSEIFYVMRGHVRVALKDCRTGIEERIRFPYQDNPLQAINFGKSSTANEYVELILSEYDPKIVVIPCGVAHGYKVLQGPCDMLYFADMTYDLTRQDEGRIEPDRWGTEWMREIEVK